MTGLFLWALFGRQRVPPALLRPFQCRMLPASPVICAVLTCSLSGNTARS